MAISVAGVLDIIYSVLMVVTPILNYYPQYRLMNKNKSIGTFSKLICYFLLISHILRIIFWFGENYRFSLFLQSITVIVLQILLLNKCFEIEIGDTSAVPASQKHLLRYKSSKRLSMLLSSKTALFAVYFSIFTYLHVPWFVAATGVVSAIFESVIAVPQCFNNFNAKSVEGLRLAN